MLGKRLLWRSGGMLVCALLVMGCEAYDPKLLRVENQSKPPPPDSGMPPAENDGGGGGAPEQDGGKPCVKQDETCNGLDDDCDGKIDEDTQKYCESIIQNAVTTCALTPTGYLCAKIMCRKGFDDCDGLPQNGCEKPFCECNDCPDAGSEDGGI